MVIKTARKQQTSRKGTKAWRKNIDISDIERHLDDKVKEEMAGGPIDKRPDSVLFTIDTEGTSQLASKKRQQQVLTIDKILMQRSAVPAIAHVKPARSTKGMSKSQLLLIKKKAFNLRQSSLKPEAKKAASESNSLDIWSVGHDTQPKLPDVVNADFVEHTVAKRVKVPNSRKHTPAIMKTVPAVSISHPGTSYNPDLELHKEAVEMAEQIELDRMKDDEKFKKLAGDKESIIALHNLTADATMEVDLPSSDEEDENEEVTGDSNERPSQETIRKKTTTERNRERRRKEQEMQQQQVKDRKVIRSEIELAHALKDEVEAEQKAIEKKIEERRIQEQLRKSTIPARLSKHNYKPLFPTVQLSEDIPDSLRVLKPEGNLFKELYNGLEKRNIIETRVPVAKRRRYKQKQVEKHSYKRFK